MNIIFLFNLIFNPLKVNRTGYFLKDRTYYLIWSKNLFQTQSCKIPGKLKIEKETKLGFFIALSPKTYILGDTSDFKR